ncbi:hypothetical protein PENANT_c048G06894 [Penicillium antarcticum]|uniref:Uncharacterized protein n=1 Tax=Penicillium antarcticum TaxID=416450 RepID=A0A1V6PRN2_9EURO|nr:hypothetical protein PENANT_c048G06894 [Penicillium antarcticum]
MDFLNGFSWSSPSALYPS